jgi:predicted DCC family thiol-disulfide oxidoreductase YuxK
MIVWRDLVLYDGECGLCDRLVQWLLRHDRKGVLSYAPLQGETARPFVSGDLDTMVFVERDAGGTTHVYERSRGVFRILQKLGGIWRAVAWLRILPRFVTDAGYRFISRNRLRWFGRADACRVPDASVKARFLA